MLSALGEHPKLLDNVHMCNQDTLVFVGDSITHQCLYTQYIEDFYFTRYPNHRLHFYNAGVGGSRASDVLARFDEDVAPRKPKYVSILLGMNDGSYRQHDSEIFQTYQTNMLALVERVASLDAVPILVTPTMFDVRAYRNAIAGGFVDHRRRSPDYNGVLASYGAWLRERAFEKGLGIIDMHGPMNRLTVKQRKLDPDFTLTLDGMHPNPAGHLVIAHAWLREMNHSHTVSTIHVFQNRGDWQIRATRGIASDLQSADTISFSFLADSLPWVVPEGAQPGVEWTNTSATLNQELFRVSDLAPGTYQLLIDGNLVGAFDHRELARGIELQEIATTPQYQQARRVAELNEQRNEKAVRVLRDQWSQLKDQRRQRSPKDKAFEQWYASHQEKVNALQESIKQYEDQIYLANQPIARRYQIVRTHAE